MQLVTASGTKLSQVVTTDEMYVLQEALGALREQRGWFYELRAWAMSISNAGFKPECGTTVAPCTQTISNGHSCTSEWDMGDHELKLPKQHKALVQTVCM